MTTSNFLALKQLNSDLFDVVHSAEHLYANQQYDYIPTVLRVFAEGVLQDVLGVDKRENKKLIDMGKDFRLQYPIHSHTAAVIFELRSKGNSTSHFKPQSINKATLLKLFNHAHALQYFYVKDFLRKTTPLLSFLNKNFPTPIGGAVDAELQQLKSEIKDNECLKLAIQDLENNAVILKQKLASYRGDIIETNELLTIEQQEQIRLKQEVSQFNRMLLDSDRKIKSTDNENENYKINLQKLEKQLEETESKVNRLLITNDFLTAKINKTNKAQKMKSEERSELIEQAEKEIYKMQTKDKIKKANVNSISADQIDEKQQEMININEGEHFLTAPPGSGKTMILTKRLEKALENHHDRSIICLTFTTRAAKEMHDRSLALFTQEERSPFIGNFHTLCLKLHRENKSVPTKNRFSTILNDEYREEFYNLAIEKIKNKKHSHTQQPIAYQQFIFELHQNFNEKPSENLKTRLDHYLFLSPKLYTYLALFDLTTDIETLQFAQRNIKNKLNSAIIACSKSLGDGRNGINYLEGADLLWQLFSTFKTLKRNANTIDYDDILCLGLLQLTDNNQHQKDFIQIDEAQDLNPIQWRIIDKLKSQNTHTFAVGDIDQSIYSFLGSNFDDLSIATAKFERHTLVNNFRSNHEIVSLLNTYRKNCWNINSMVAKSITPCQHSTMLLRYPTIEEEYKGAAQAIQLILKNPIRKVGLLLPTNKRVEAFCSFFDTENIPYFRVSSSDLLQKSIIQDWFSLIRMHKGTANRMDWYNIVFRLSQDQHASQKVTRQYAMRFVNKLYDQKVSISDIAEATSSDFDYKLKGLVNAWDNDSVIIFDTETTGLDFDKAQIVQLAAVKIMNGVVVDTFDKYINIGIGLTSNNTELDKAFDDSAKIHKITRNEIHNGELSYAVFNEFFDFVGDNPLIAHNMNFDNTMLRMGVIRCGHYLLEKRFIDVTKRGQFDSLLLARTLLPNESSYKLADLLANNNLEGINSHNALDDVKATASLMQLLIDKVRPSLDKIDEALDEFKDISKPLQLKIDEVNSFFKRFYILGTKLTLAEMLDAWLDFAHEQSGWYQYNSEQEKKAVTNDIKRKLISWLEENRYEGHIQEIFNDMSPKYQRLFTLKESDLIQEKDRVVISTIHRSKGLEFETVLLPEATDSQYPGWRPDNTPQEELDAHKEEQKRLLYVALSRPKNKLIVSYHMKNTYGYSANLCEGIKSCYDTFTWKNC